MSERPTPPPEGDGEAPEEQANDPGVAAPTPSTWAGRARQGGDAEEGAEEAAAGDHTLLDAPPPAEAEPEAPAGPEPARRETVETDTIAIGDAEAAQEAAHEALRARAAAHAAKHPAAAAPVAPAGAPPPVKQLAATPPPPSAPPPATLDVGEPPKRGVWARFLAGAVLIIVSIATATAVSGLVFAAGIADKLGGLPGLQGLLTVTDPENPQTFLILGSDRRKGETDKGRSDTTILLRVSPGEINVLSIPRDLRVLIPGHGIDKFNAAYTYGGPKLTTATVKQLTGLDINHVVNVNFTGFAEAVNAIGCVYIDVDHHYYHSNVGLASADQYSEIDIPAGYQRMCGLNALAYVRYRHEDNDLVRSARQQAFLREARAQVPTTTFLNDANRLVDIFTSATTSDINDTGVVIGLARLMFDAKNAQIHELHFPGNIGGPDSLYVTASQQAVRQVVAEFLGTAAPTGAAAPAPAKSGGSGGKKGSSGAKKRKPSKPPPESNLVPTQSSSTLVDVSSAGADAASRVTKTKKGHPIGIPVYYPTKLVPGGEFLTDATNGDPGNTRGMVIDGGGGQAYYGYKIVAEIPFDAGVGYSYSDYFGFSGTNWRDAPILNNPTEEKTINGHDYLLFFDNGRLRQIGWRTDQGAYWVENDLLETLTIDQMLGMAESMTKYVP